MEKEEDKLLIAKVTDKIKFSKTRGKIEYTDFLDLYEKSIVEKTIKSIEKINYTFYGAYENAERTTLIIYPDKYDQSIIEKNYKNIFQIIRIVLPLELQNTYTHKDYLGGLMKLGIKREKIGDILVDHTGADIIVIKEIADYLIINLTELTRFNKSEFKCIELEEMKKVEDNKEELKIIVASLRLDSIVSDLAKVSRSRSSEIITQERVFLNFENITNTSKQVKEKDVITIRGKGRFYIDEIVGSTKKGRHIIRIFKSI